MAKAARPIAKSARGVRVTTGDPEGTAEATIEDAAVEARPAEDDRRTIDDSNG